MPFTAQELQNIANTTIDFHLRGQPVNNIKQPRPLYDDLMAMKKTFPAGKEYITGPVKGQYTSAFVGYTHDDDQAYGNPANVKRWQAKWYEMGAGIKVTYTELKANGIHILDTAGSKSSQSTDTELVQLVNLLDDKVEDLTEGGARSLAEIFWRDGTQDAKVPPGIQSIITTAPTSGMKLNLDSGALSWWRNRAVIGTNAATATDNNMINVLTKEFRQLRRYGSPKHKVYAGSDWLDAVEKEMRAKGTYTQDGWAKTGMMDAGMADIGMKGIAFQYDPLLDDLGFSKYCYVLDLNAIRWQPMQNEEMRTHNPERPPEKYVLYRAVTTTGGITANQLNTSGVYSIL